MSTTTGPAPADTAAAGGKKKGKKKLILILVVILAIGGAAYWFVLKPSPADAAPKPGKVMVLDAVQVNLAAGHYLRVGIALQLTSKAEEVDGSEALDATIELFSGRPIEEITTREDRTKLKKTLEATLTKDYDGDVMAVYFTEFVTQ